MERTEITPKPPRERIGKTWSSLPEYIARLLPHKLAISATCEMFPLASFTATIFSILESSKQVAGVMFRPVLLGTLYRITGMVIALAIAL